MRLGHRKTSVRWASILFGWVVAMAVSVMPAMGQIDVLNGQIERIDSMIEKNDGIQQQFRHVLDQLAELAGTYGDEIRNGKADRGVRSLKGALANPRLNANLQLLRRVGAYEALLNRRLGELNAAKERLRFLRRRAVDDVKLMQTLAGMDADALLGQIDNALDRNQLLMDRPVVDVGTLKPISVETAWRRAAGRR